MKPAAFDYIAAHSLEEALDPLYSAAGDASVIAGGQTLMPLMALRLAAPSLLIDLNPIPELQGITRTASGTRIGATTRQAQILKDAIVAKHVPGLSAATRYVGHYQTRARGTIGGSLALAEPAAEYPAVALALGAQIEAKSKSGIRTIAADDYFLGTYTTALAPDEVLTSVLFPDWGADTRMVVHEVARRAGDFALVGLFCAITIQNDIISRAGISWFGMGPTPMRSRKAEAALTGSSVSGIDLKEIADIAVSETDPPEDSHARSDYRQRVARRIFPRIAAEALGRQVA